MKHGTSVALAVSSRSNVYTKIPLAPLAALQLLARAVRPGCLPSGFSLEFSSQRRRRHSSVASVAFCSFGGDNVGSFGTQKTFAESGFQPSAGAEALCLVKLVRKRLHQLRCPLGSHKSKTVKFLRTPARAVATRNAEHQTVALGCYGFWLVNLLLLCSAAIFLVAAVADSPAVATSRVGRGSIARSSKQVEEEKTMVESDQSSLGFRPGLVVSPLESCLRDPALGCPSLALPGRFIDPGFKLICMQTT